MSKSSRRRKREAEQKATLKILKQLSQPPTQITKPPPENPIPFSRYRRFLKSSWQIVLAISAVAGLLGFLALVPRISVTPGAVLDRDDPFKTPFALENQGYFAIRDVKCVYFLENIRNYQKNNFVGDVTIRPNELVLESLGANRKTTIYFTRMLNFNSAPDSASCVFKLDYTVFHFLKKHEEFKFHMAKNSSGERIWLIADK